MRDAYCSAGSWISAPHGFPFVPSDAVRISPGEGSTQGQVCTSTGRALDFDGGQLGEEYEDVEDEDLLSVE